MAIVNSINFIRFSNSTMISTSRILYSINFSGFSLNKLSNTNCQLFIFFCLITYLNNNYFAQNTELKDDLIIEDTIVKKEKKKIILTPFQLINKDTISIGPDDELVYDEYTAMGKPGVYDALHSFNYRRSDKFGGYINVKINAGLERIRKKGFNSDIKKLYIQTNTNFDLNVITCTQLFKETVSISIKQWNQYLQHFSILHSTSENKALYLKDVFVKV